MRRIIDVSLEDFDMVVAYSNPTGSITLYSRIPGAKSSATRVFAVSGLQAGASVLVLLALCTAYVV